MREALPGFYRGVVEDVNDPERRFRHRVRVHHIHPDEIPVNHLPFAETLAFGGGGFGDIPHYEVGDRVAVIFEGGDREYPSIIGGWVAAPGGVSDLTPEQSSAYLISRKRWRRIDRKGNMIEISEVEGELHVKLQTKGAEITLSQVDNGIVIKADGRVRVEGEQVEVQAVEATVEGQDVTVFANKRTLGVGQGTLRLFSTQAVEIYAGDVQGLDLLSEIKIGKYTDDSIPPVERQTKLVTITPETLDLGTNTESLNTTRVNIKALTKVLVEAPEVAVSATVKATVDAPDVVLTGTTKLDLNSSALINIVAEGAGSTVNVKALAVNIEAATKVDVKTTLFDVHT